MTTEKYSARNDALYGGYACPICGEWIETEARGGPHPSPGSHNPAFHVAKAYDTGWSPPVREIVVTDSVQLNIGTAPTEEQPT